MLLFSPLSQAGNHDQLGIGSKSIGQSGCLLTCVAMVVNAFQGMRLSVSKLNDILKAANCFAGSGLLLEKALLRFGLVHKRVHATPAEVEFELDSNRGVILGIDLRLGSSSGFSAADHFIVCVRKEGDQFVCLDPAGGREVRLDSTLSKKYKDATWHAVEMISIRVAGAP